MCSFVLPLSAEIRYFGGLLGDIALPAYSDSEKQFGAGGGASLEAGVYLDNLSLALLGSLAFSNQEGDLIHKMNEYKIGVEVGYDFGNDIIPFLPNWLCIRPNLAFLADIYKAEGFRSQSKKLIGLEEESKGVSPVIEAGLLVDFPNLLKYRAFEFIPVVGYYETFRMEKKEMIYSGRISLGMRVLFSPTYAKRQREEAEKRGGVLNVFATTNIKLFSPNGDGEADEVIFTVSSDADQHEGVANWELRIYDPGQKVFYSEKGRGKLPENYTWKGAGANGDIVEGGCIYQYVWYVKARDGSDGYIPGIVETDVMLHEEDGVLKFSLSSIQFGPNSAKYEGLTDEQIERNKELYDTVARILNKYSNYNITIEGHANNVTGTQREHLNELLPLSQKRAETVKDELISRGVEADRLTAIGRGSEKMLTNKKDEAWKNRRVEFILTEKE